MEDIGLQKDIEYLRKDLDEEKILNKNNYEKLEKLIVLKTDSIKREVEKLKNKYWMIIIGMIISATGGGGGVYALMKLFKG